jgi:CBS domain-containing protein
MNKVSRILKDKGSVVWSVPSNTTALDAVMLMADKKIGAVLVIDDGKLVGIFTERDFAYKIGCYEKAAHEIKISEVMTPNPITVSTEQSVNDCMALMTDNHVRHLPVLDQGQIVGVISIGDVVKDLIEELQFMVEQMEKYIMGLR